MPHPLYVTIPHMLDILLEHLTAQGLTSVITLSSEASGFGGEGGGVSDIGKYLDQENLC